MSQTHVLRIHSFPSPIDVPAALLVLMSRAGRSISGDYGRPERLQLARLIEPGALTELLLSERPFRASSEGGAYVFREP